MANGASVKSFRPKDGSGEPPGPGRNGDHHFHGEKRSNETHASTSDPEARPYRKGSGQPAKLAFMGHALMENRHALVVDVRLTAASGLAERKAAVSMVEAIPGRHRITVGADKAYGTKDFVTNTRALGAAPHVAQNTSNHRSTINGRTPRLRRVLAHPQTDRRGLRLDQGSRLAQNAPSRHGPRRLDVHADRDRLEPDPPAKAAGGSIITPGIRLNGGSQSRRAREGAPS